MTKRKYSIDEINQVLEFISTNWSSDIDKEIATATKSYRISMAVKGRPGASEHSKRVARDRLQTEEGRAHLRRIQEMSKGRVYSEDVRLKMATANLGKKFSDDHKAKISQALKGKTSHMKGKKKPPMSDETKQKLRKIAIGRVPYNKGIKTGPMAEEIKQKIRQGCLKTFELKRQAKIKEK